MVDIHQFSDSRVNRIPQLIIGFGGVLLLSVFGEWVVLGEMRLDWFRSTDLFGYIITTSPFVFGIIYGGYWLERSGLGPERYARIVKWLLGGLGVYLGINLFIILVFPAEIDLSFFFGWVRFAIAMGAAGGLLIGIIEARAIQRERAAERAIVHAEELEYRSDQLEFFNSILRHDVLNGMTVIRGHAELLVEDLDEDDHHQHAETILRWSDDVVDIVQRVRNVIQTLTRESEHQLTNVGLSAIITEEVARVQSAYPEVTFETDIHNEVHVKGDELLNEVIGNVLSNAAIHNDPDELCVTVTTEKDEERGTIRTRISDTGQGVPDDRKDAVFRRGETDRTSGGFGLFFVDAMVGAYGGEVWIEDNAPQGATFVIELPLRRPSKAAGSTSELVPSR
ncbi:HAMP domain-containing histidine kinase (plasmid) [Haloferax mediterranei ATCC 33500]|uniref:Histidine kinase n=1 Tax=Haloferax mediterranei (strain ATCC 33500 / DSM 1411 / JCM 8866 / NBRC 14739 / NCIMB 2177 / R-4) TaxID=523841 RepID=I3R9Y4_HALMT|nr:HAMP domain-containing sensor histidine kinase [Haloferax mediterranei]AFK21044.1 signal transduction histidine kinase / two-component system, OmpR family, sensor histidine kinase CreC [Haloferax mediterranei ATCC 33500]AHZ24096.1 histidine kinase [Haloferax mediterranei ATCC 33500]EMA05171.1 signal transduction histidine kinase / two-component system, OmpR family, sensor histidine kinase CreC [Haloferax mediterranei ATCC 33500]MDX5989754.1 HAMP domain-containing sensor histidine kinase [Hal